MPNEEWIDLTSEGQPMRCMVYAALGKPRAGVVMIHGGFGLDAGVKRLAKRLALVGYTVIGPDMYHREKGEPDPDITAVMARIRRLSWTGAKADILAAEAHLVSALGVPGDQVAVLGFCMGGALAWMAAAEVPCKTAVLFYPHDLFKSFGATGPVPFDLLPKVPLMGHFGADDTNPSPADAAKLSAVLNERNVAHQFCHYAGAGHGFVGANPQLSRPIQANTSIDRTVGWLDMHMK